MKKQLCSIIKQVSVLVVVVCALALGALAQSNTGSIVGVVQDVNGSAIPGATVTVTNVGTNDTKTVQANGEGYYEALSLPTGVYRIVGTASGFADATLSDVRLAVGDRLRMDLQMGVGAVSANVMVAAQTNVETETSTLGDTITSARVANVPVNGRDFTGLLSTVPGSVQTTNQFQTSINGIPST
ncbi:MAG TPA: carboxypeptidase-like regulatory domain-containing protein, partial [Pyrinomonadaceae bacterium]|nr:carboxypeptidase-like regulatory domain-containing protein [Pyrinomonadaceae bacterium]